MDKYFSNTIMSGRINFYDKLSTDFFVKIE